MDYKLELVLIRVSDPDRAKRFYLEQVGFDLLVDTPTGLPGQRVVQMTRPARRGRSGTARGLPPPSPAPSRDCTWWWPTLSLPATSWPAGVSR